MSEVRKWLDIIGLAQYADAFESNDLDIDLLGQVDDQLLKDIGVLSAGHRLRIRSAIGKLTQQEKTVSPNTFRPALARPPMFSSVRRSGMIIGRGKGRDQSGRGTAGNYAILMVFRVRQSAPCRNRVGRRNQMRALGCPSSGLALSSFQWWLRPPDPMPELRGLLQ